MQELSTIGLKTSSGIVYEDIYDELNYPNNRVTYAKMWYDPVISSANHTIRSFVRGLKYEVKVNSKAPTKEQEDQIAFIRSCMQDMETPFEDVINEALSFLKYGFSVHEKVYKYRNKYGKYKSRFNDEKIGWAKLPIRSQDTITEWIYKEYDRELTGLKQELAFTDQGRTRAATSTVLNKEIEIPRKKFLLFRHNAERNNPEGNSPLKSCFIPWKYKTEVENFQSIGISRDMGGLPVFYMPPEYMEADAPDDKKAFFQYLQNAVRNLHANSQAGLILPKVVDPDTKEALFDFKLVSVDGGKLYDTVKIINSYENKILMTYLADVLKLGQESSGSYALSDNKTNLLIVGVRSFINEILQEFNNDLIPQTLLLNGWELSDDIPKIVVGDIEDKDLEVLSSFIQRCVAVQAIEVDQGLSDWLRQQIGAPATDYSKKLDKDFLSGVENKVGEGMKTSGEGTSKGGGSKQDSSVSNKAN